ncbi:hypothetical protein NTE28_003589 [Vibrio harveyi]|nr:hypothetical protein [Vibrio harveyi]
MSNATSIMDNLRNSGGLNKLKNRKIHLNALVGYEDKFIDDGNGNQIKTSIPVFKSTDAWVEVIPPQSTEFMRSLEKCKIRQSIAEKKIQAVEGSDDVDAIMEANDYMRLVNADILTAVVIDWSDHFGKPCTDEYKKELFTDPASDQIMYQLIGEFRNVEAFVEKKS